MSAFDGRVYVLTDRLDDGLPNRVGAALRGGATAVQVRLKEATARQLIHITTALKPLCAQAGAKLIVNDRLDVALAAGADGVHLGPHDIPLEDARGLVGPDMLLGGSAGSVEAAKTLAQVADYLGVGAIYDARPSKADASAPRGPQILRQICAQVSIPVVGIGGVGHGNAGACIEAGASGVAVIRAAFVASGKPAEIERSVAALRREVDQALKARGGQGA